MKKTYIEITPFFPTLTSFRGSFIYDQVKALQRSGRFSDIVVLHPKSLFEREISYEYGGIAVYYFPWIESPSYILNGIFDPINKWLFKRWWRRMGWNVEEIVAAHAHVSTMAIFPLIIRSMNNKIITLLQHHDLDPFTIHNGKWADKKWNLFYKVRRNLRLFCQIDYHVCVSDKVKDSLLAFPEPRDGEIFKPYLDTLSLLKGKHVKPSIKHAIILYNGVDTAKFCEAPRKTAGFFSIGCIANFVSLKGHQTLLKACNVLIHEFGMTDLKLSLVGSGPLLGVCQEYIRSNDMEKYVEFRKEVQHAELCDYYNSLNLFVLPSFFEGFGCVFIEAAACGVPFMSCENQGIERYIAADQRDKWFFPAGDYRRLAQKILDYRSVPEKQLLTMPWQIDELIDEFLNKIKL